MTPQELAIARQRAEAEAAAKAKATAAPSTGDTTQAEGGLLGGITDVARAIPSGLRSAYESVVGAGGDIYNLEVSAAEKVAQWLGASPETLAEIRAARGKNWLPTSADVTADTSAFIGEPYQPQTKLGEIAHTGAGFLTNPSKNIFRSVVAPTIGTEVGGEVGKWAGNETMGRLLGGISGATVPGVTSRLAAGPKVSPTRADLARQLTEEGVDLTAGQVTGRKALKYLETGPYESKPASIAETQGKQFTRAALKRAGIDAEDAGPETIRRADESFTSKYNSLVDRAEGVPLDDTLETELLDNVMSYERLKGAGAAPAVDQYFKRISDAAQQTNGVIPSDVFKTIGSDIAKDLKKLRGDPMGNSETIAALRQFKDSLFDSIGRNGPPDIVKEWKKVNNQYRNFKIIEKAMGGAGEATGEGAITPGKLRGAVETADKAAYVRGKGDLAGLARGGQTLMTDLPQSGTTPRLFAPAALATAGGQIFSGHPLAAAGTATAAALPFAASSLLTSKPVRTALIRQATEPLPMVDPMTMALMMRQSERGPR